MSPMRTFYIGPRGISRPKGFVAGSLEQAFKQARMTWGTDALVCYGSRRKKR